MKQSLVERLEKYLKSHSEVWFPKGELARLAESVGYMGETCGRRLREMTEEGLLESRENSKGHVEYKWHKTEKIISSYERVGDRMVEIKQQVLC